MVVFDVAEFESVLKIEVAPFLVGLRSIYARNLGITRERWIVRARRHLHLSWLFLICDGFIPEL